MYITYCRRVWECNQSVFYKLCHICKLTGSPNSATFSKRGSHVNVKSNSPVVNPRWSDHGNLTACLHTMHEHRCTSYMVEVFENVTLSMESFTHFTFYFSNVSIYEILKAIHVYLPSIQVIILKSLPNLYFKSVVFSVNSVLLHP